MNPDDFEKRITRAPLRQPPAEWRAEILSVARANIRTPAASEAGLLTSLRQLLARIPAAWAAVAAVWLVIIGINSLFFGPSPETVSGGLATASRDTPTIWNLQRAEMSFLVDHYNTVSEPLERPPRTAPTPRSDRCREDGLGDFQTQSNSTTFA